ncbi:hypothetical protein [Variovorax gossypii]|uniref:hypothetical protein n=1 Tax=uncultured Variovorax sp. TaxID=114708 RepID=UPI0026201369|nr:hypothetical protein [uncultured Variovorax sp.]
MSNKQALSAQDRAALASMLEAPETIEFHGKDSSWRNGLLGSIMSAAALTFTMGAAAPNAHADSLFERTMTSVATNAATSALGNLVRQGIQGGVDGIKRGVTGEQAAQPAPTVFNQRDRQPMVVQAREVMPTGALPGQVLPQVQMPQVPAAVGNIFQNVSNQGQSLASALGFGGSDVPGDTAGLRDAMLRNDVSAIAQTAPLRPVMFPVVIQSGDSEFAQFNDAAVRATSVVPAGAGGQALVRDGLMLNQGRQGGPNGAVYVGSDRRSAACVIVMHAGKAGDTGDLSRISGMPMKTAMDFSLIREAARCTQQAETVAAQYDAANGNRAKAQSRIAITGLVDVHSERAIGAGSRNPVDQQRAQRSADRYADAFAALAVNARQPLSDKQWDGVWAWRMGTAQTQDTSGFLQFVREQAQRDPIASQAMRADDGPGFNAQAVAAFLKPVWKSFEARESELEGNRDRVASARTVRQRSALEQSLGFGREGVDSDDNRDSGPRMR